MFSQVRARANWQCGRSKSYATLHLLRTQGWSHCVGSKVLCVCVCVFVYLCLHKFCMHEFTVLCKHVFHQAEIFHCTKTSLVLCHHCHREGIKDNLCCTKHELEWKMTRIWKLSSYLLLTFFPEMWIKTECTDLQVIVYWIGIEFLKLKYILINYSLNNFVFSEGVFKVSILSTAGRNSSIIPLYPQHRLHAPPSLLFLSTPGCSRESVVWGHEIKICL